jgi:glutathione peroxidase
MISKLFLLSHFLLFSTIYQFSINDLSNNAINFSDFAGKKILIVNTASNSKYASQYNDLETLFQQYKDSLIVIAIPSNSFGNEPASDTAIGNFVNRTYSIHYLLAAKIQVNGTGQDPLYNWLTDISQNNMFGSPVKGDFQKFLIDEHGLLIGVYAPSVSPTSDIIQNAIHAN